jgi:uncharacterized repeat protein (TIGR01451 family)
MQAAHDLITDLNISFSGALNIGPVTGDFSGFSVVMTGVGVKISTPLSFGNASQVQGVEFSGGLTLGNNSGVISSKIDGLGLTLGSSSSLTNSVVTGGVRGAGLNTVTANTISGLASLLGSNHTILNNSFLAGGLSITGTTLNPSQSNLVDNNDLTNGQGLLLKKVQNSTISSNAIFGSSVYGITLDNDTGVGGPLLAGGNLLTGNRIGIDRLGSVIGNALGIRVLSSSNDSIGGSTSGLGNWIAATQGSGIEISSGSGFVLQGNLIGTNAAGAPGMGNLAFGIAFAGASSTIGGAGLAGNVVGGNGGIGIQAFGNSNLIQGNSVGVSRDGSNAVPNANGGLSLRGTNVTVGGSRALGLGNTVSANAGNGVSFLGGQSLFQGNTIGSYSSQPTFGNSATGFSVTGNGNTIGGASDALGNQISGNGAFGVLASGSDDVFSNNWIGTDATGAHLGNSGVGFELLGSRNKVGAVNASTRANFVAFNGAALGPKGFGILVLEGSQNALRANSVYENSGRGIALGDTGPHRNDAGVINGTTLVIAPDLDTGSNGLQNYPVALQREGAQVRWMLNSAPSKNFTIEIYGNTAPHASGYGDARTLVQTLTVSTDAFGHAEFLTNDIAFMAATATDSSGNTSELSIVDTDLDGLADAWETLGIDTNEDGIIDLVLPNANPNHKDMFMEVDAMLGFGPVAASVAGLPVGLATGTALDYVVKAFAQAPAALVRNPDGLDGINLHIAYDETSITRAAWTQRDSFGWPAQYAATKDSRLGTSTERASANWDNIKQARSWVFRYALFADSLSGTTDDGMASDTWGTDLVLFGKDFAGDDQVFGTADDTPDLALSQAGLFMHLLGHTLGLTSGGGSVDWNGNGDRVDNKPNYQSVMNSLWVRPFPNPTTPAEQAYHASWVLDYSRSALPTLNENSLNESAGIGGVAGRSLRLANGSGLFVAQSGPVDWNGNGSTNQTGLAVDLNGDGQLTSLVGREDWSKLRFYFGESRNTQNFRAPAGDDVVATAGPTLPVIDLVVTQQSGPAQPRVGNNLTYTLIVQNNGPDTATGVSVVDTLPSGVTFQSAQTTKGTFGFNNGVVTFNVGDLTASASATLTVIVKPNQAGVIVNAATVSPTTYDPNLTNNSSSLSTTILPALSIDLSIVQQISTASPIVGNAVTYTLTARNNSSTDVASGVAVVDTLPPGVTYQSATAGQGTFTFNNGVVTFNVGDLGANATATLTIVVVPNQAGTIVNSATISPTTFDPNLANNTSNLSTTVQSPPPPPSADLSITQQINAPSLIIGNLVTYTLTIRNNGPDAATATSVIDTLPAGLIIQSASSTQGTFLVSGGQVTFNLGTLAASGTATLTVVATTNALGNFRNDVTVASATTDPASGNNTAIADLSVLPRLVTLPTARVSSLKVGRKKEQVITLTFDGALSALSVGRLGIYRLAAAGRDKKYGTKDDKITKIKAATFDNKTNTLTLRTKTALNLANPLQLLIKSGSLTDNLGRAVDGSRDGQPGGDVMAIVSKKGVVIQRT